MSQRSGSPQSSNGGQDSQNTLRPLSLGNVLSAGFTLYRSHLKPYLGMSLKAHAWGLIPIYGWAKFNMLSAAIAKHAFGELTLQPESMKQSQEKLLPEMWGFFVIQLLVGVILFTAQFTLQIISNLIFLPFQFIPDFDPGSSGGSVAIAIIFALFFILILGIFLALYFWLVARFFVPEVAYAVEEETDMVKALERSWVLTRGKAAWQIVLMICLVVVIITPLYFMMFLPPLFILIPSIGTFSTAPENQQMLVSIALTVLLVLFLWIVLFTALAIVVMPMWQTLKAVIYYDMRVRREGMGLELRDRQN